MTEEWSVKEQAIKASQKLDELGTGRLAGEVLKISPDSAAIVCEIDGVDYIMTMQRIPIQRPRPN